MDKVAAASGSEALPNPSGRIIKPMSGNGSRPVLLGQLAFQAAREEIAQSVFSPIAFNLATNYSTSSQHVEASLSEHSEPAVERSPLAQAYLSTERQSLAQRFEESVAQALAMSSAQAGELMAGGVSADGAILQAPGWVRHWIAERLVSVGDNESQFWRVEPAHWQPTFEIEAFVRSYLNGQEGQSFARLFGDELQVHTWQESVSTGEETRYESRRAMALSSSLGNPQNGGWLIAQDINTGQFRVTRSDWRSSHPTAAPGNPFRIEISVVDLPAYRPSQLAQGTQSEQSAQSARADELLTVDFALTDPLNVSLVAQLGPPSVVFDAALASRLVERYGLERATRMTQLQYTHERLREAFVQALNLARANPPSSEQSAGIGWKLVNETINRGNDEAGLRTSTEQRWQFDAVAYTHWYGQQAGDVYQAFARFYGDGAQARDSTTLILAQGAWRLDDQVGVMQRTDALLTIDANSTNLGQLSLVQFDPLSGWITPTSNLMPDEDWFDLVMEVAVPVIVAYIAFNTGGAFAEWLELTAVEAGAGASAAGSAGATSGASAVTGSSAATLSPVGTVVSSAVSAGLSATFNGLSNDRLSWKSVIRAVLSGALTASAAQLPTTDGIPLASLGLSPDGTDWGQRFRSMLGQSGLRGALSQALGGDFSDGFKQAALQFLAVELTQGIEALVGQLKLSGQDASAMRAIGQMSASALRIAATPGHDLQALAQDWLQSVLPARDPVTVAPPAENPNAAVLSDFRRQEIEERNRSEVAAPTPIALERPRITDVVTSTVEEPRTTVTSDVAVPEVTVAGISDTEVAAVELTAAEVAAAELRLQRFARLREQLEQVRSLEINPSIDLFTDAQINAYNLMVSNGNDPLQSARVAHVLAEALGNDDLVELFNYGVPSTESAPAPHTLIRPTQLDARGSAAYDGTLNQWLAMGASNSVARSQAYESSMLTVAAQKVDELDARRAASDGRPSTAEVALERNRMVSALVSRDVYFDSSIPAILPSSVYRLSSNEVGTLGLEPSLLSDVESGFFSAIYRDRVTGQIIVANRGTEFGLPGRAGADMLANALQAMGLNSNQYVRAINIADRLTRRDPSANISFVGHSLGGGLASAQATVVNRPGITYNAAGLHGNTVRNYISSDLPAAASQIDAVFVRGELVSAVQDRDTLLSRVVVSAAQIMPAGRLASTLGNAFELGPPAVGVRVPLVPIGMPSWESANFSAGSSGFPAALQGGTQPTSYMDQQFNPVEAYQQHGINRVIFSQLQRLLARLGRA